MLPRGSVAVAVIVTCVACAACGGSNAPPPDQAPGSTRTATTAALETGADLMQAKAPVEKISMYLDGFHMAKDEPDLQMESHHYCNQVNEDFAQCVLFDGNTGDARLQGVEYIISASLYAQLPAQEKAYWHPHNYEILSGELRMPGIPASAEMEALKGKINSYGKTWHLWMTGTPGHPGDRLPLGPPRLAWSFNRDGELNESMLKARDQRIGASTTDAREQRADLTALAQPQGGVDVLAAHFPGAVPLRGVTDNGDAAARPVPTVGFEAPRTTGR